MTDRDSTDPRGDHALRWWASHQPKDRSGKPNPRATPAVMARLRRAATPLDAAMEPATLDLHARLHPPGPDGKRPYKPEDLERTCLVAAILAHVREDAGGSGGEGMATARLIGPDVEGKARVNALRFRRILAARTPQDTMIAFRRLVSLAGRTLPIADLATSLLDWTDPKRGDDRRIRWAFAYHDASAAAPSPTSKDADSEDSDDVERTDS